MKPLRTLPPADDDEQLRLVLDRLERMDRRLARLERRVAATTPPGWECTVCERGWVTARAGVLECDRCTFRRAL